MADLRTRLQREADSLDCDLYRLICRAERMYDGIKRHTGPKVGNFHKSLMSLRSARSGIRTLMHADDRSRTS